MADVGFRTHAQAQMCNAAVSKVLNELCEEFDYVVCDSPAGIETGQSCIVVSLV